MDDGLGHKTRHGLALWIGAVSMLAVLLLAAGSPPATAQSADTVTVPNFWDPKSQIDRPDASAVKAIRFLTTADFPPFQFLDRRGLLIGFNVDLATAICRVLGVECALQTRPFDTLQAALVNKEGDAVIAGLSEPRARAEGVSFTRPYFMIPARFVTRSNTAFDAADPKTGFVGVVCNSAQLAYISEFFAGLTPACYTDATAALEQLRAGTIDLVFADALSVSFWLHDPSSQACCQFASGPFMDERYFGPGMSIAVRTDDRKLKQALDYALRELHRTGVYEELYLRYFPVSLF